MSPTIQDVMTSPVVTISPDAELKDAAARLRAGGFSALPVVDSQGRLVGILSEADLLARAERPATSVRSGTLAGQLMSRPVVTVSADASLTEAADLLLRYGLQRLPVVDGAGRLAGIASRGDLLKVFLRSDEEVARDVRERLRAEGLPDLVTAVEDGVVTLSGGAGEEPARRVVEAVAGVVAVRDVPAVG